VAKASATPATPPAAGFRNLEIRVFTAIASTYACTPQASTHGKLQRLYLCQISKTVGHGKRKSQDIVFISST
jgi:hypothetical protein